MAQPRKFFYGGQAVIEGVLIRGQRSSSLAVRRKDGTISVHQEPLSALYSGRLRNVPMVRGVLTLVETLVLGAKALHRSTQMAMHDHPSVQGQEMSSTALAATMTLPIGLGVVIFFLLPLLIARALDPLVSSPLVSNLVEGLIRLLLLLGYIWGIGRAKDIRRVFAYHGAEHMVVHTHEAGLPLTVANARRFGTPHPRCGTAFLLAVVLVSIIIFALLGRPPIEWRILSRILLLPVIAALSYEIIRFSGGHPGAWMGRVLAYPGLLMQQLTTRKPEDDQIEVAIHAMQAALAADAGREYQPGALA
ncbi:MAG: DUF1385 domain-containing protein [SAR202 cluster bacterium]|nr:DUF1385 domain-containing protein [SAR202 cluster bacterium]